MSEFASKSVKGKRPNNEDSCIMVGGRLFAVADGLGGHAAGEVASKIAVEKAEEVFKAVGDKVPEKILREIFDSANDEIIKNARANPDWGGMGTTLVACIVDKEKVYIANVGDSMAFILSDDKLSPLTKQDRTFGMLNQALGRDPINVNLSGYKAKKRNLILLCSDGLTDFLHKSIIEKILNEKTDLLRKADALVEAALQADSTDNITACLIRI